MLEERIKRTAKSKPLIKKPPPRDPKAVKGGTSAPPTERERSKPHSDDDERRPEPQGQEERKALTGRPRSSGMFQMDLESVSTFLILLGMMFEIFFLHIHYGMRF